MNCSTCTNPSGNPSYLQGFETIGYKAYAERYFSITVSRCKNCGNIFYVNEHYGHSSPSSQWLADKSYVESMIGENIEKILYSRK